MVDNQMNRSEAGVTTLLRQLGTDTTTLLRNEIALAKLEAQEMARTAAMEGARVGAAIALAAVGGLTLVAWLVLVLGDLLGGHYATATAIVGILLLGIGSILARKGVQGLRSGALKPAGTIETLQEDKRWAAEQIREFRHELSNRSRTEKSAE